MKMYMHTDRNGLAPISCETEIVPKAGEVIKVKHHKFKGTYIVDRVESQYIAVQKNGIDDLNLEAVINVYLLKHE